MYHLSLRDIHVSDAAQASKREHTVPLWAFELNSFWHLKVCMLKVNCCLCNYYFLYYRCTDWQFDQAKKVFLKKYANFWQISSSLRDGLYPFDGWLTKHIALQLCVTFLYPFILCPHPPHPPLVWLFVGPSQYTHLVWVYNAERKCYITLLMLHGTWKKYMILIVLYKIVENR